VAKSGRHDVQGLSRVIDAGIPLSQLWAVPAGQVQRPALRGAELICLTHKALIVLGYLVERCGQLVTKDELFEALWPGVVVSESALVVCVRDLRRALGDTRTGAVPRAVRARPAAAHRPAARGAGRGSASATGNGQCGRSAVHSGGGRGAGPL
jgi:hypothetical protein